MRRSNTALPARDACRALWKQQLQQRRVLSSTAFYPGSNWLASGSTSTTSSSSASPAASSSSKSRTSRLARPSLAFAYSTSNPAYPLPGSNNEIDPRGVDYSLFETEDDTYDQHASSSTIADEVSTSQHNDASAATRSNTPLSAPTQLLVRLINDNDFQAATTVLQELQTLRTPLDEPLPLFSTAALWAIRNGKKHDMLTWMSLCPGYIPGTKYLETASKATYPKQVRSIATNFRKCFMVLLDSYGDDMRLLQRASMIAAEKGLWSVLQSTLAQILRFGVGRLQTTDATNLSIAWQYFNRLVQVHQSQRGLRDYGRRKAISSATVELRALYNLGVRTLALAGRLDDAVHWAEKSADINSSALSQVLRLDSFTENLLLEELVRAGPNYMDQARWLADTLARSPNRLVQYKAVDIDAVAKRIDRETSFTTVEDDVDYGMRAGSTLDNTIQSYLQQGDVVAARDHLLSVLRSATRVRRGEDEPLPPYDTSSAESESLFSHLPSASALSDLHDVANKLGTVAVTSSLTESDMRQKPDFDGKDSSASQETLTAEEFMRPIRDKLLHVRGGKGLWETARLYGFVKKDRCKEAVLFYVSKAGFKMPSGGITTELVSLALDQQTLPKPSRRGNLDNAEGVRGKHWPSTHAINLMLKAITAVCLDSKDYSRLTRVYTMWKESSLPSTCTTQGDDSEVAEGMIFEQWPPSQRPDSHTFDPFIRAFGRLNTEVQRTTSSDGTPAKVEKQSWGSSQTVLEVIRDMTDIFYVQPSVSTWTIALECLAREGRDRWSTTTDVLARAVGINTTSLLSSSSSPPQHVVSAQVNFAPANVATYTALIHALVRVPHQDGGSMVEQAAAVRDDLLVRTLDLDLAVRQNVLAEKEDEEGGNMFFGDLLTRWQALQQAGSTQQSQEDKRKRWQAAEVLKSNQGRTLEAMRELWLLESTQAEEEPL